MTEGFFISNEEQQALDSCRLAWEHNSPEIAGIPVVNIRQFVGPTGSPRSTLGDTEMVACSDPNVCANAYLAEEGQLRRTGVLLVDDSLLVGNDDATMVAHEFGHALGLAHGDGLDNDGNCIFDECCDRSEGVSGPNLMNPDRQDAMITELQQNTARAIAANTRGTITHVHGPEVRFETAPFHAAELPKGFCNVNSRKSR